MQKNMSLIGKSGTLSTATLKDQAYALIRENILFHKLTPGEVYAQDAFCSELGISRTPVREALLQLQQEGYVRFLRGKGIEVVPVTGKRAAAIIEARYYLEPHACYLAAKRRTEEHLKKLDAVLRAMDENMERRDPDVMYQLDRQFHALIFEAADNEWLSDCLNRLRDDFLRVETYSAFDSLEQAHAVWEEHCKIANTLRDGDASAALEAMQEHLYQITARTGRHLPSLLSRSKL